MHDNATLVRARERAVSQRVGLVLGFLWAEDDEAGVLHEHRDAHDCGTFDFSFGEANRVFAQHAVHSLQQHLQSEYGVPLLVRQGGSYSELVHQLVHDVNAERVLWSERFEPAQEEVDLRVSNSLRRNGIAVETCNTFLMRDVRSLRLSLQSTRGVPSHFAMFCIIRDASHSVTCVLQNVFFFGFSAGHFGTMLPFLASAQKHEGDYSTVVPAPAALPQPDVHDLSSLDGVNAASSLSLINMPRRADGTIVDWGKKVMKRWSVSEKAALATLRTFLDDGPLDRYEKERHLADGSAVARISPYLRHGLLGPRTVQNEVLKRNKSKQATKTFTRRFIWRELAYWQLLHWPSMPFRPIRPAYASMRWIEGSEKDRRLKAWAAGQTGYPLVDAAMRELWHTGWVQQSARMTAAGA